MATLAQVADGNLTGAATFALCSSAAELDTESHISVLSAPNSANSSSFVPGAVTVRAVAIKIVSMSGTAGTLTVALRNMDTNTLVASVTVNKTDIPASATDGWVFFEFAPVLLLAATNYAVFISNPSGSSVSIWYHNSATNNWNRQLVTTTTQAPATGDKLLVCGALTGAGVAVTRTCTMDSDGSVTYGSVTVCPGGTLNWDTTGGVTRHLKLSGVAVLGVKHGLQIFSGGTVNIGTSGTPIPVTSTAILDLLCASNVEFGVEVRGGTFRMYGAAKVPWALLNADAAAAATNLTCDRTLTNWKSGDLIGIAPGGTPTGVAHSETGTLAADTVGAGATLSAGLSFSKLGSVNGQMVSRTELVNLTRNVKIRGASNTLQSYINISTGSTIDWDYGEFYWLGSTTANRRGVDSAGASVDIQYCSFHEFGYSLTTRAVTGAGNPVFFLPATASPAFTFSNNVMFGSVFGVNAGAMAAAPTFNDNVLIACTSTGIQTAAWSMTGNRVAGTSTGFLIVDTGVRLATFVGNVAHNCGGSGFIFRNLAGGSISGCHSYYNNIDIVVGGNRDLFTVSSCVGWSSATGHIDNDNTNFATVLFTDCYFDRGVGTLTPQSVRLSTSFQATFRNCYLGAATPVNFTATALAQILFDNCAFPNAVAASPSNSTSRFMEGGWIAYQHYNQVAGDHRYYKANGTGLGGTFSSIERDTAIKDAGAASTRLTPTSASYKLEGPPRVSPAASGASLTFSVKVRKSVLGDGAAYNGNQPRLILKRRYASGVTTDTVLDTATDPAGTWETLTGSTPAAPQDCVFEVLVDCDGTAGWVNVDTWSVTGAATDASGTMKYWRDGAPLGYVRSTGVVTQLLGGTVTGVADLSGTPTLTRRLSGTVSGVGDVSGSPTLTRGLSGTVAGVAGLSGFPTLITRGLSGTVSGVAALSGTPTLTRRLTGTVTGVASISGRHRAFDPPGMLTTTITLVGRGQTTITLTRRR